MNLYVLLLVGVALVVVGYYVVQGWIERKRAASYEQYCGTRGFHYQARRPGAEEQYATVAKIFTRATAIDGATRSPASSTAARSTPSSKGSDEAAVRRLFTPSLRQALTAKHWHFVAGAASDLFWWQERGLPPPDQMEAFLAEGDSIRKIFESA